MVVKICGKGAKLNRVYVFTPHGDIGDTVHDGLDLVVMPPDPKIAFSAHAQPAKEAAYKAAREVMQSRGGVPRLNTMNRMVFLFPEQSGVAQLFDQAKTCLAWKEIVEASNAGVLTLDNLQVHDAKTKMAGSEQLLTTRMRECYKHLLVPETGTDGKTIEFRSFIVTGTAANSVASLAEDVLTNEELLVPSWSPIHLGTVLETYFKNAAEVSIKKLWKDICQYPMFPRLLNEGVLVATVKQGIENGGMFGYADGKVNGKYSGFKYGEPVTILTPINDTALLISHEKAEEVHEARKCPVCGNYPCICAKPSSPSSDPSTGSKPGAPGSTPPPGTGSRPVSVEKRKFYGTVKIDPHGGAAQFSDVMAEVVNLLTAKPGVTVSIKIDIRAESPAPFDKATVIRQVEANCTTLKFEESAFEP